MESSTEFQQVLREIVAAVVGADVLRIDSSTSMASLNFDSLTIVSVVALCCARFEAEIGTDDVLNLYDAEDFGEFVTLLGTAIKGRRSCAKWRLPGA